ncbi:hypothetical protein [Marinicrinis lubricantis]|uniref:DUF2269 family protein n=1 Tax=Marinicrinis lubricantis TaxID=2086470 RepID=A0ABW1IH56_9BACL
MYETMKWLHIISAYLLVLYVLIPFLVGAAKRNTGLASFLAGYNRIGQYLLIIAFLAGGYMISQVEGYSTLWIIVAIVLVLVMFAMSGMMGKPLKALKNRDTSSAGKAVTFSIVFIVAYAAIMAIMSNPQWLS